MLIINVRFIRRLIWEVIVEEHKLIEVLRNLKNCMNMLEASMKWKGIKLVHLNKEVLIIRNMEYLNFHKFQGKIRNMIRILKVLINQSREKSPQQRKAQIKYNIMRVRNNKIVKL